MAIHTATGEASRVYSISVNTTTDGCYLRGRGASCWLTYWLVGLTLIRKLRVFQQFHFTDGFCCCCWYSVPGSKPRKSYPEWSEEESNLRPVWLAGIVCVWTVWWRQRQHLLPVDKSSIQGMSLNWWLFHSAVQFIVTTTVTGCISYCQYIWYHKSTI